MNVIQQIEAEQIAKFNETKKIPEFRPGDTLKVDPNAPAEEDPYADPQFQVPDDLVW